MRGAVALEDLLHPLLGRYLGAPGWVKAGAGRAYAMLPSRLRLGGAYETFRSEAAGPAFDADIEAKLDATLRWALETVPAYQAHRGLLTPGCDPRDVLARLPVTDKLDIKRHPERYLSRAMPAGARLEMFTGGSTRNPLRFYLHKHVTRSRETAYIEAFHARAGVGPGDEVLSLRGRTVPSAARPGGKLWMREPVRRQTILSCDHLEARHMPRYAEALAQCRPACIEAFPSALYPLARWLAANPMPEFTRSVKAVLLYSENVLDHQMAAFRAVFDGPVLAHYGHSERVLMAATMPGDTRYFFWPRYGHFELLDAEDRPITRPGVPGFVVGTSFDNPVMPFVRYRTGDRAVLAETGHPDLPGFAACERIVGRMQEHVACRDGRLISVTTLGVAHFPELARVEAIQYEQRRRGQLVLKVAAEGFLDVGQRDRIARAVERKTQGGCDVEVIQVERIERTARGKASMLQQHLDLRRELFQEPE